MPARKPLEEDPLYMDILAAVAHLEESKLNYPTKIADHIERERAFVHKKINFLITRGLISTTKHNKNHITSCKVNVETLSHHLLKYVSSVIADKINQYKNAVGVTEVYLQTLNHMSLKSLSAKLTKYSKELEKSKFLADSLLLGLRNMHILSHPLAGRSDLNLLDFYKSFMITFRDEWKNYFKQHIKKKYPEEETSLAHLMEVCYLLNIHPLHKAAFMKKFMLGDTVIDHS